MRDTMPNENNGLPSAPVARKGAKKKTILILASLLLALAVPAGAWTFILGGHNIDVPDPNGYVRVTSEMTTAYRLFAQEVDPANDILANYIPAEDEAAALAGEMPTLSRHFALKLDKKFRNNVVTRLQFEKFRREMRREFEEIVESVRASSDKAITQTSDNMSRELDANVALKLSNIVPLGVQEGGENVFFFSMYLAGTANVNDSSEKLAIAVSGAVVFIDGKVLYLYAYGEQEELDWTQQAVRDWARAILAANDVASDVEGGSSYIFGVKGETLLWGVIGCSVILLCVLVIRIVQSRRTAIKTRSLEQPPLPGSTPKPPLPPSDSCRDDWKTPPTA